MSQRILPWRQMTAICGMLLLGACAQQQSGTVASNPPPVAPGPSATWFHVQFDSNSYVIGPNANKAVADMVAYLQSNPGATATIIGRTDTVGSPDYNMHLSHRRADAVRDALVYSGAIAANRVETRWTGEQRPVMPTPDGTALAMNRVVDVAMH